MKIVNLYRPQIIHVKKSDHSHQQYNNFRVCGVCVQQFEEHDIAIKFILTIPCSRHNDFVITITNFHSVMAQQQM